MPTGKLHITFSAPRTILKSNGRGSKGKNKTLQEMRRTNVDDNRLPTTVFGCYSQNSKAYIILNKHTRRVEESLNVTFDETPPPSKTSPLVDDDLDEEEAIKVTEKKNLENDIVDETLEIDEIVNIKESRNHPLENVIGNLNQRTLRWRLDELAYGIPSDGPYQTNLPSIKDIISSIRINQDGQVCRIRHEEEIDVLEYQVLSREIEQP
ncbi:hypothetical protein Tco_0727152 [Tanacetum coccineum]|uniref:Retroviral polymerase SH3-like domain-containing protein n=1 Tax=Tanacetum coccineum TaxID=301880 RepID=A0ABQ4YIJ2_9ASTR